MACVSVEITGNDGKKHMLTTGDQRIYAVQKAARAWSLLWDADTVAIVRRNDESWNVPIRPVIDAGSKGGARK